MSDIFHDSSRYFHISAFYALSLPYYHMEHHTHPSYEIMYITSGSCRVFCLNDKQDVEFSLKSGQFVFIRPDIPHRLEIPDGFPCSILNLEFSLTSEKSPVSLELLLKKDPVFSRFWSFINSSRGFCSGTDSRNFGYSLKDLLAFLQRSSSQIKNEEFLFFLLFCRMLTELAFCSRSSQNTQGSTYLKKALRYIDEHYLEDIDIPDIAAYAGINKSYLQALFTEKNACTINAYINRKRMAQAAFLLCNSTLHITDIAFASGYNSRQHFGHTFEKFYHMSPSRYRSLHNRPLRPDTAKKRYHMSGELKLEGEPFPMEAGSAYSSD